MPRKQRNISRKRASSLRKQRRCAESGADYRQSFRSNPQRSSPNASTHQVKSAERHPNTAVSAGYAAYAVLTFMILRSA